MEALTQILPWIQIVLAVLLVVGVLMQLSSAGIGATFGGGDSGVYHTRRGFEKFTFRATIFIAVLFVASTIIGLLLQ
jgi:protein translocase SecG subunit